MAKYSSRIGKKISKLVTEENVPRKQAIAMAINMGRRAGVKAPAPLKQKAFRNMLRKRKS